MIADEKKYYYSLKNSLLDFFHNDKNVQVFIFGSSTKNDRFGDIDVGVMGKINDKKIRELKELFEESNFPFFVDVINFNTVDEPFRKNVLDNKILWIKR
ncbi:nucleotidyltransferase domain-containing protein [Candidatus Peregrinibacteria bacterium]|nr:nucleotidyltransferase domain-containing protein [Candidatus Peregrinibacteria bacterium]